MNRAFLRTGQIGVALLVTVIAMIAVLFVLGLMSQETAIRIALNLSAIIALGVAASGVLLVLFAIRPGDRDEP